MKVPLKSRGLIDDNTSLTEANLTLHYHSRAWNISFYFENTCSYEALIQVLFYLYYTNFSGLDSTKPWKLSKGLGSLVVLCGGRIRSNDETLLCALDSEGRCNLFDAGDHHQHGVGDSISEMDGSFVVWFMFLLCYTSDLNAQDLLFKNEKLQN